jgi:hypothetical protein
MIDKALINKTWKKLGKTEKLYFIDNVKDFRYRFDLREFFASTAESGKRGRAGYNALVALEKKGLVTFSKHEAHIHYGYNGKGFHFSDHTATTRGAKNEELANAILEGAIDKWGERERIENSYDVEYKRCNKFDGNISIVDSRK